MQVEHILREKGRTVVTLPGEASLNDATRLLAAKRLGAVVVVNEVGEVVGILSERDVVRALALDSVAALDAPASRYMTGKVRTCLETDSVEQLMAVMTEGRFRHLPVHDAGGKLCGIVSIGDVVKAHIEETSREAAHLRQFIADAG